MFSRADMVSVSMLFKEFTQFSVVSGLEANLDKKDKSGMDLVISIAESGGCQLLGGKDHWYK